jgi:hypothetical protein
LQADYALGKLPELVAEGSLTLHEALPEPED